MEILLIGLSHKTADISIREGLSFSIDENKEALKILTQNELIKGAVIFSTCNRMEILLSSSFKEEAKSYVLDFLASFKKIPKEKFLPYLYFFENEEAASHIFSVAASLDSMIIGEPQILGQVKESYKISASQKNSNIILNKLFHKAFATAKKIRTETKIGSNAVSISYAAIELAKKIFGKIDNKKVLLIGAGEMAELAIDHLLKNKVKKIFVANRTFQNAVLLAEKFLGEAVDFAEILKILEEVDIVVSSTASPNLILYKQDILPVMKKRKGLPIFFIDIALPRDIDPEINKIPNAYVYDIDNLKEVIEDNKEEREKEAIKAKRIIDEAVLTYFKWLRNLDLVPTIVDLQNKIDSIIKHESTKILSSPKLSNEEKKSIEIMLDAIKNKIVHNPIIFLKSLNESHRDKNLYLDTIRNIFDIN